jgi:cyclopropane-fatty-acyl-phospholipid synthase
MYQHQSTLYAAGGSILGADRRSVRLRRKLAAGTASMSDRYVDAAIAALRALFGGRFLRDFGVTLWDGTHLPAEGEEHFALLVNEPGALRVALSPPIDLGAGQAFAAGLIEIEGDAEYAIDTLYRAAANGGASHFDKLRVTRSVRRLPKSSLPPLREASLRGRVHSRERDRAAIGFHYDQPIEFYRSFLDRELVYSCAYYDDGIETLDAAQSAKLDYVLQKVRLREGERLLDIGCGWGALVVRAAQRFGARVIGITLSRPQYEEAQRRIAAALLGDRARVELRDYRELDGERFDKIVSVGMFEHVGHSRLPEYFRAAFDALRPGGLFLNHGIALEGSRRMPGKATGFIERFVFPDGELVRISEALRIAEGVGFEVRDVENLREHYGRTLRAWVANLERNREVAIAAGGVQSYRTWRLYMAGSAQGFASGRMGIFQSLLARPGSDGEVDLPPTRRDLYDR